MRAIRLEIYQETANYRVPTSDQVHESYPLPPYSTVIGMIHAAVGAESYIPMKVSVQGHYFSTVEDLAVRYEFSPSVKFEAGRHTFGAENSKKLVGITQGVTTYNLLTDIELVVHIMLEDESLFDIVKQKLENPVRYLSLGRHEDLIIINKVSEVEMVETVLKADYTLPRRAYVPNNFFKNTKGLGSVFSLNKDYVITTIGKSKIRQFNKVKAQLVAEGMRIAKGEKVYLEKESSELVFPA